MMTLMTLLTTMSAYLINTNELFIKLDDYLEVFDIEVKVISALKCHFANHKTSDGFVIGNEEINVYEDDRGYLILYYGGLKFEVEVKKRVIINYLTSYY